MDIPGTIFSEMKKAGKPLRIGEIATLTGIDKKEVEKAIKQLNKEGKIFSPIRCCWQVK